MFFCGKEEPITNNESLYEKNGSSEKLVVDQSSGICINRYSFVCKKESSINAIPILIENICALTSLNVFAIISWLVEIPGKSSVAAKVIEKKYLKNGWTIYNNNDYYLAVREVQVNEIGTWPLFGINPLDMGFILMMGESQDSVLNLLNEGCSLFLARTRYFAPDRNFLEKLGENGISAIYQVNDDLGNTGIVFVGCQSIDMMLLSRIIQIEEIFEGKDSYRAFIE